MPIKDFKNVCVRLTDEIKSDLEAEKRDIDARSVAAVAAARIKKRLESNRPIQMRRQPDTVAYEDRTHFFWKRDLVDDLRGEADKRCTTIADLVYSALSDPEPEVKHERRRLFSLHPDFLKRAGRRAS